MKKVLSFICAIVLAFGVNAAPQLHQLGAKSQETLKAEALARIDTHAKKYASKVTAVPQRAHKAVAVTPIDTMEVELSDIEITDATGDTYEPWFQIIGSNENFPGDVYVCVNSASIAGTFTIDDLDLEYTGLWLDDESGIAIVDGNGIVEVIETNKVFSFYLFDEEGHCYHVFGEDKAPTAEETVDFIATNLEIDDSYFDLFFEWLGIGLFDIYATDNNGLDLAISVEADKINGTFTEFSGSIGTASIYSGEITVNKEAMTVTGSVLCKNNVQYNLNLTYVKPEKTRERVLDAEGGEFADVIASFGAWEALYESDSIILQLAMFADEIAGDYTIKDNYGKGYSFFAEVNGQDTIWDLIIDANFNVAVNLEDSLVTITGVLLGQNDDDLTDIPELTVNLVMPLIVKEPQEDDRYEYDEEVDPFNVNFAASEVEIDEQWFADYGDIMVYGENAAGEKIILDIYDYGYADGVFTPGTYNIDLSYADGTVAAGFYEDGYLIPSIAGTVDAQGYFDKVWYLIGGVVTISEDAIVVDAINSNALSIKSTISLAGTAVENIEAGEQSINKTLRNGQVLIRKNNKVYTILGQEVK
ncbi:MAG: hypothetical protein MJZ53_05325 [Paludibacteraceae bacterium]|nr:hypothetical protein [Paludibacteraceae bacterium]